MFHPRQRPTSLRWLGVLGLLLVALAPVVARDLVTGDWRLATALPEGGPWGTRYWMDDSLRIVGPDTLPVTVEFAWREAKRGGVWLTEWNAVTDMLPGKSSALRYSTAALQRMRDGNYQLALRLVRQGVPLATFDKVTILRRDTSPPSLELEVLGLRSPATWNGMARGTANDPLSGVAKVEVGVHAAGTERWLEGNQWVDHAVWNRATGTTQWSLQTDPTLFGDAENYDICARAVDSAGNADPSLHCVTLLWDRTPPKGWFRIETDSLREGRHVLRLEVKVRDAMTMRFANHPLDTADRTPWQPYASQIRMSASGPADSITLWGQFRDQAGNTLGARPLFASYSRHSAPAKRSSRMRDEVPETALRLQGPLFSYCGDGTTAGVTPQVGKDSTLFAFCIRVWNLNNLPPSETWVEVDTSGDGTFTEDERFPLSEGPRRVQPMSGPEYAISMQLPYQPRTDGMLSHRFVVRHSEGDAVTPTYSGPRVAPRLGIRLDRNRWTLDGMVWGARKTMQPGEALTATSVGQAKQDLSLRIVQQDCWPAGEIGGVSRGGWAAAFTPDGNGTNRYVLSALLSEVGQGVDPYDFNAPTADDIVRITPALAGNGVYNLIGGNLGRGMLPRDQVSIWLQLALPRYLVGLHAMQTHEIVVEVTATPSTKW